MLTRSCLTVAALRRSIVYQPLALIVAILMLPSLSWMGGGNQHGKFQARAQGGSTCQSTTNSIIQNYCTTSVGNHLGNNYYTDLVQLESDAVNAYLAAHNLPTTDAHVIYDYGRADLRNAIRGYILSILLGVIATPPSSRTGHQRLLYLWLQDLAWVNEIADYRDSYNEFLKWQNDPCHYTLDPLIASQYGIAYDGAPFCGVTENSVFTNAEIPAPSYFKAVGLKKSYQAWADKLTCPVNSSGVQDKSCKVAFQETTINMDEVAGIATAAGSIATSLVAGALAASLSTAFLYATGSGVISGGESLALEPLWVVSSSTTADFGGLVLGFAGPVIAVVLAIAIGFTAGVKTFVYQQSVDDLNDLKSQITAVTNTPPDLNGMAADTTGLGLFKIENTVMPQTFRTKADGTQVDLPSTAPLPAHGSGTDLSWEVPNAGGTYNTRDYLGWNGEIWSAQTWGGWFVQTCANGTRLDDQADGTCIQADSISADLHYIDWRAAQYLTGPYGSTGSALFSAARFGDKFFATRAAGAIISQLAPPSNVMSTCAVSPGTSVSNNNNGSCWSYVASELPMVDGKGLGLLVSLTNLLKPAFTSPTAMAFRSGVPSTQTITVIGDPIPMVCLDLVGTTLPDFLQVGSHFKISGSPYGAWALTDTGGCGPSGLTGFGTVQVQLTFDGALDAPNGTYNLKLAAGNGIGGDINRDYYQTFTINVTQQLSIISPDTMNVTSGVPANFTVVATGDPTPALTVDGVDLGGMTFTDNHDGTATISGIDSHTVNVLTCTVASNGNNSQPCAIVATNTQGTYRQPFTINLTPAPTAQMTCDPCSATFLAGNTSATLLTATGAATPVSWGFGFSFDAGGNPVPNPPPYPWLKLVDHGDGTATLAGSAPWGTSGPFTFDLYPWAKYSLGRIRQFTANVVDLTSFNSPNSTTSSAGGTAGAPTPLAHVMTAGSAAASNSFTISANTGTISLESLLPKGLSFASFGNTATISGSPATGTGGQYLLRLTDDGGTAGMAAQQLVLNVNEAPSITSNGTATMFVGTPGSFAVTTTGFPSVSTHVVPANPQPPTDPSQGDGMYFTVTGLPADLRAANLSPAGFATGTLTIQGTPSAADIGTHQVQIRAQNGVGSAAQQTLTLNIVGITGPAPASGATCNGNYNGTFGGSITVSAGQNCAFYSGGVTGNVVVNGGHLALTNATVTGNMSIQGGSGFSIGAGTAINGNLTIQNVASGSSAGMICQAQVGGNLQVSNNAIPIDIGLPQVFCYGNSFSGNVDIQGNTAAVAFNDNAIAKNLSCSGNASISGSGNIAAKKTGQCSGF